MAQIGIGTRVGPYTVIKPLEEGQGGMARLYVAKLADAADEDDFLVALKITKTAERGSPEERDDSQEIYHDALNNEAEILSKLKHPNIVRLFPIQTGVRSTPYIARANDIVGRPWYCVMEYLAGGSLATMLDQARGGRLSPKVASEIAHQVASALEYIHLKEIAHLDVKPDNILFRVPLVPGERPEIALIDFGIARREKQTGLAAGAASYMSPERIMLVRGEIKRETVTNQRPADVYSLGVVLYRSVSGKLPFSRRDKSTTTDAILKEEPIPISRYIKDVPPPLEDVIMRCLQKDPTKRATVTEFLAALDEAVAPPRWTTAKPKTEEGAKPSPPPPHARGRRIAPLAIGCLGGLVFGGVVAYLVFSPAINPITLTPIPSASPTRSPTQVIGTPTTSVTVVRPTSPLRPPTVTPFPTFTPPPVGEATATPTVPASTPTLSPTPRR